MDPLDTGVLVGLNLWLRDALTRDRSVYREILGIAAVDEVRRQSPVVFVLAIPLAVKLAAGGIVTAAAGVTGVLKAVDKYFDIQNKRADIEVKHAQADKTRAEAQEIRARLEQVGGEAAFAETIAPVLAAAAADSRPDAIEAASQIGGRIAAVTAAELDRNPSVQSVSAGQ